MTHQEILTKAIEKAIAGGWIHWSEFPESFTFDEDGNRWHSPDYYDADSVSLEEVIFNHDFAKALFGNEKVKKNTTPEGDVLKPIEMALTFFLPEYVWQMNLQQMVISEKPIEYLGRNI